MTNSLPTGASIDGVHSLEPGFLLATACCTWPRTDKRLEIIRARAAQIVDWEQFVRIIKRHRVAGLAQDGLSQAGIALPDGPAQALRGIAGVVAHQNLKFAAESLHLQKVFQHAKLPILFLKGAVLEKLAYGVQGLKVAWDIDILASPDTALQASALLEANGYLRLQPPPSFGPIRFRTWIKATKECVFSHVQKGIFLELHWRVSDNPMLIPTIGAASPSQSVGVSKAGSLPTLADEELFSYLCVHGACHDWSRLKWLADLAALLATKTEPNIERLYRVSLSHGAGRCSAQALLLCERLLGTALPRRLTAELRADAKVLRLEGTALDVMAGGGEMEIDDHALGNIQIQASRFLFQDGWRYWWKELCTYSVGVTDMILFPLPHWLYFLYPVIRAPSWILRVLLRAGKGPLRPPIRGD